MQKSNCSLIRQIRMFKECVVIEIFIISIVYFSLPNKTEECIINEIF